MIMFFLLFGLFFVVNNFSYADYYNFPWLDTNLCSWPQGMNRRSNSCSDNKLYANYVDGGHSRVRTYNLTTNQPINAFDVRFKSTVQNTSNGRWANAGIFLGATNDNGDEPIIGIRSVTHQSSWMSYSWFTWYTYQQYYSKYGLDFKWYFWPEECNTVRCPHIELQFKPASWPKQYYVFNIWPRWTVAEKEFRVTLDHGKVSVYIDNILKYEIETSDTNLFVQQSNFKVVAWAFTTNNGDFGWMRMNLINDWSNQPIKIWFWEWTWGNIGSHNAPQEKQGFFWYRNKNGVIYHVDDHRIIWPYFKTGNWDKNTFVNVGYVSYPVWLRGLYFDFKNNTLKDGEEIYLIGIKRDNSRVKLQTITKVNWDIRHYIMNNDLKGILVGYSKNFDRFGWSVDISVYEDRTVPYFYDREPYWYFWARNKSLTAWTKKQVMKITPWDVVSPVKIDFPWNHQDKSVEYIAPWWIKTANLSRNTESCCDRVRATFFDENGQQITVNPNEARWNGNTVVNFNANQKVRKIKLRYTTDGSTWYWPIIVDRLSFHESEVETDVPNTFNEYPYTWVYNITNYPIQTNPYQLDFPWNNQDKRVAYELDSYLKNISFSRDVEWCADRAYITYYREDWSVHSTNPNAGCNASSWNLSFSENDKIKKIELRYTTDWSVWRWPIKVTSLELFPKKINTFVYENLGKDINPENLDIDTKFPMPAFSISKIDNKLVYANAWSQKIGYNNNYNLNDVKYKIVDKTEDCNYQENYQDRNWFAVKTELWNGLWWITPLEHGKYMCMRGSSNVFDGGDKKVFSYFPIVRNIKGLNNWSRVEAYPTAMHKVIDRVIENGRITFKYPIDKNSLWDQVNHWNYYFYVVNEPSQCESTWATANKVKNQDLVVTRASDEGKYICMVNEANGWQRTYKVEPIYFPYTLNAPTVSLEVKQKVGYGTFISQQIASQLGADTAWMKENTFELFIVNNNECSPTSYNQKIWQYTHTPNNYQTIQQSDWGFNYNTKAYVPLSNDLLPVNYPLFRITAEWANDKYLCWRAQAFDWQYGYSQPIKLEWIDATPPTIHFWQFTPSGVASRKTVNLIVYDQSHLSDIKYSYVSNRDDCRFNGDWSDPLPNTTVWEYLPLSQNNTIAVNNELYNNSYLCVEAQDIHWNKKRSATIEFIFWLNVEPPETPIVNNPYSLITNDNTVRIEVNTKDKDIDNYKITFTKGMKDQNNWKVIEKIVPYQATRTESNGSTTTIININDLEEDDYTFKVKAIDVWGMESPEAEWYTFTLKNANVNHPEYTYELTSNTVCSTELYKLLAAKFAKINVNIDNINCLISTKTNDINFQKIWNYRIKWNVSFSGSKTFTLIEAISQLGKSYPAAPWQPLLDPSKTYTLSMETTFSWSSLGIEPLQTDLILKEDWTDTAIFSDTYKKADAKNGLFFHVLNLPIIVLDASNGSQPTISNHEFIYYEKREGKPGIVKFFNINAYKWYTSFAACNGVPCEKNYYLQWKGFNDNSSSGVDLRTIQADIFYDKNGDKQVDVEKETVASLGYRIPDDKYFITNKIEFPRSSIEIDPTNPNTLSIKTDLKGFLHEDNQEFLKANQFYFVKPSNEPFKEIFEKDKAFIEAYKNCFSYWPNPANTAESQITGFNSNNTICNPRKMFIPATDKTGKKVTSIVGLQNKDIYELTFEGHDSVITIEPNAFANNQLKSVNHTHNLKINVKNNAFVNNPWYNNNSLSGIVAYQPRFFNEVGFITNGDISHFKLIWFEKSKNNSCFYFDKTRKAITWYIRSEECTTDVFIPKELEGIVVEEIADFALQNKGLTSVRFEEGSEIRRIGRSAFTNNLLKNNLVLPESVRIIDFEAFWGSRFNKIYLGSNLESLGEYSFATNGYSPWTWVGEIVLPKTLNHMSYRVFWGTQFTNVKVPNEVFARTGIFFKDGILYRRTSNTTARIEYVGIGDTFNIPNKVEYQGAEYFVSPAWPSEFSNWLKSLSTKDVDFDQSGYSEITLNFDPEYSTRTKWYFKDWYLLYLQNDWTFHLARNFHIEPNKIIQDSYNWKPITTIGNGAFWWMGVETVRLPNQLKEIHINAFHNNRLTSVELPNSVRTLWPFAFRFNYITSITQNGSNKFPNIPNTMYENGNLFVKTPNGYGLAYTVNQNNYNVPAKVDNMQVTSIDWEAFSNAKNFPSDFTIPNSINSIGNHAFYQTNIQNLTIRDATAELAIISWNPYQTGLRSIGIGTFQWTRIKKINLWNDITSIGEKAFLGADGDMKLNGKVRWITQKSASSISIGNNANIEIRSE